MLTGQLGTLNKDGRQVGGFLDWRINAVLDTTGRSDWKTYKERAWLAKANRFWILEKLEGSNFHAVFYQRIQNRLVVVSQNDVRVEVPDAPLNKIVIGHLKMRKE